MSHPRVCAVVLNYNGAEDTIRCVRSLQTAGYPNVEIVVVDNASMDQSVERIRRELPALPLLEQTLNTGYAGGNNIGIRWALQHGSEYVLVVNNDVVFEKGFLQPMVDILRFQPDVGVATCKVFYESAHEKIFSGAGSFSMFLCTGLNHGGVFGPSPRCEKECDVNFACGVLLLVKREVLEHLGFFDDRYFMYFEDVEFSRRVLGKYRMMYTPVGVAYHKSGGGKGWKNYTELYLYYHTRNRLWVFEGDTLLYRVYVGIFTFLNAVAKSLFIVSGFLYDVGKTKKRLCSLWRGFRDGLGTASAAKTIGFTHQLPL